MHNNFLQQLVKISKSLKIKEFDEQIYEEVQSLSIPEEELKENSDSDSDSDDHMLVFGYCDKDGKIFGKLKNCDFDPDPSEDSEQIKVFKSKKKVCASSVSEQYLTKASKNFLPLLQKDSHTQQQRPKNYVYRQIQTHRQRLKALEDSTSTKKVRTLKYSKDKKTCKITPLHSLETEIPCKYRYNPESFSFHQTRWLLDIDEHSLPFKKYCTKESQKPLLKSKKTHIQPHPLIITAFLLKQSKSNLDELVFPTYTHSLSPSYSQRYSLTVEEGMIVDLSKAYYMSLLLNYELSLPVDESCKTVKCDMNDTDKTILSINNLFSEFSNIIIKLYDAEKVLNARELELKKLEFELKEKEIKPEINNILHIYERFIVLQIKFIQSCYIFTNLLGNHCFLENVQHDTISLFSESLFCVFIKLSEFANELQEKYAYLPYIKLPCTIEEYLQLYDQHGKLNRMKQINHASYVWPYHLISKFFKYATQKSCVGCKNEFNVSVTWAKQLLEITSTAFKIKKSLKLKSESSSEESRDYITQIIKTECAILKSLLKKSKLNVLVINVQKLITDILNNYTQCDESDVPEQTTSSKHTYLKSNIIIYESGLLQMLLLKSLICITKISFLEHTDDDIKYCFDNMLYEIDTAITSIKDKLQTEKDKSKTKISEIGSIFDFLQSFEEKIYSCSLYNADIL